MSEEPIYTEGELAALSVAEETEAPAVKEDPVPIVRGSHGLTGRPLIVRIPEEYDDADLPDRAPGKAIPPNCLRALSSPLGQECRYDCPGVQRDGGCLCDIVRAANEHGIDWKFEVDPNDNYWDYAGPDIPGLVIERRDFGQIHTSWEPGAKPAEPYSYAPMVPSEFVCPWCEAINVQSFEHFNYWCSACGKNAKDHPDA